MKGGRKIKKKYGFDFRFYIVSMWQGWKKRNVNFKGQNVLTKEECCE